MNILVYIQKPTPKHIIFKHLSSKSKFFDKKKLS